MREILVALTLCVLLVAGEADSFAHAGKATGHRLPVGRASADLAPVETGLTAEKFDYNIV